MVWWLLYLATYSISPLYLAKDSIRTRSLTFPIRQSIFKLSFKSNTFIFANDCSSSFPHVIFVISFVSYATCILKCPFSVFNTIIKISNILSFWRNELPFPSEVLVFIKFSFVWIICKILDLAAAEGKHCFLWLFPSEFPLFHFPFCELSNEFKHVILTFEDPLSLKIIAFYWAFIWNIFAIKHCVVIDCHIFLDSSLKIRAIRPKIMAHAIRQTIFKIRNQHWALRVVEFTEPLRSSILNILINT